MTSTVEPKHTSQELKPLANTFATLIGGEFHYFPIKLGERKGNFVELLIAPPMLAEGFVTFEKSLFRLSKADLFKGKVNVSSPVSPGNSSPVVIAEPGTEQPASTPALESSPVAVNEQSGVDGDFRLSVDENADLAWVEQIGALLHLEDPEADWERIPDAA